MAVEYGQLIESLPGAGTVWVWFSNGVDLFSNLQFFGSVDRLSWCNRKFHTATKNRPESFKQGVMPCCLYRSVLTSIGTKIIIFVAEPLYSDVAIWTDCGWTSSVCQVLVAHADLISGSCWFKLGSLPTVLFQLLNFWTVKVPFLNAVKEAVGFVVRIKELWLHYLL